MEKITPIKIRISNKFLDRLVSCTHGSWEDRKFQPECFDDLDDFDGIKAHPHVVAQRFKSQIRLESYGEAMQMLYEVSTGTFSIWQGEGADPLPTAIRIAKKIHAALDEKMTNEDRKLAIMWGMPTGL